MLSQNIRLLDTKLFNAFIAAAQTENFSEAARCAFMTQSGISQHIAKLEEQLGCQLFSRVGKQVFLNDCGKLLLKYIKEQIDIQDNLFNTLNQKIVSLSGTVSYAMPPSCLFSDHFPQLLEKKVSFPDMHLNVTLSENTSIIEMLLSDAIDFGFVTCNIENPYLNFMPFCNESYILVSGCRSLATDFDIARITDYKFIAYPGSETYCNIWLKNYLGSKYNYLSLSISGTINDINGAVNMVAGKLGIGIFPRHCVQEHIDAGRLFEIQMPGSPLENTIYIVSLSDKSQPLRVTRVIQWFMEMVSCKKNSSPSVKLEEERQLMYN